MPKAPSFSTSDEDEKTAIDSGWEEEASTTVEQGDVADKIRTLGLGPSRRSNTSVTSTDGGIVTDEPTVDDQRGAAALAMLPPPIVARLVVTQGNDSGQSIEVRPGKTYTIGRGIDNDLVLTDIAVSRKHFDIRNENGAWVLADRGSGNGTLVNSRIEDAPFMLASGDVIEIGNTSFRFDFPNGAPRVPSSFDVAVDDELEQSTMSGKQTQGDEPAMPHQLPPFTPGLPPFAPAGRAPVAAPGFPPFVPAGRAPAPGLPPVTAPGLPPVAAPALAPVPSAGPSSIHPANRPKTLPPPALLPPPTPPSPLPRPRSQSNRPPPVGYPLDRPSQPVQPLPLPSLIGALAPTMSPLQGMAGLQPPPQPATTLPLPQMANRPPLSPAALLDPSMSAQPTTLPGQGPPRVQPMQSARGPYPYPSASELQGHMTPNGSRGPIIAASAHLARDASSTEQVHPISYANGQPPMAMASAQQAYSPPPQLFRRVKMVLGGAGLALIAAVATIAIIKGTSSNPEPNKANPTPPKAVVPPKPTVEPIHDPKTAKSSATSRTDKDKPGKTITPITPPPDQPRTDKVTSPPTSNPPTNSTTTSPPTANSTTISPPIANSTTTSPPTGNPPPTNPPTSNPPTSNPPATNPPANSTTSVGQAPSTPGTPKTDKVAIAATPPTSTPSNPPTTNPAQTNPTTTPGTPKTDKTDKTPKTDKVEVAATPPPKNDKRPPKRNDPKRPPPKTNITTSAKTDKVEVAATPPPKPDKKRTGRTTQDVKNDADVLYRAKRFSDAAALVTAALPSFSGSDSQELKTVAAIYSQLGKNYNVGMAPGTKATDAYAALRRARDFDRSVGSAFTSEIERALVNVAAKAALSYAAAKEYELAFQAVRQSEALGSQSPTNKSIRDKLEEIAGELYRSASSEMSTDPDAAKKKLRQILGMVDQKNPLYGKATKLLNGS